MMPTSIIARIILNSFRSAAAAIFAGSFDCSVFVWDIGGRKGTVYELHGHRQKVTNVKYLAASKQLLSAGEDGHLILWDMSVGRTEARRNQYSIYMCRSQ